MLVVQRKIMIDHIRSRSTRDRGRLRRVWTISAIGQRDWRPKGFTDWVDSEPNDGPRESTSLLPKT
jgi:hypothetical protein